jgi:hypothetical protein
MVEFENITISGFDSLICSPRTDNSLSTPTFTSNRTTTGKMSSETDLPTTKAMAADKFLHWETMPWEIREHIFFYVDQLDYLKRQYFSISCHIPELLVALRRLPISYKHVLLWFAKRNKSIYLSLWARFRLGNLLKPELQVIEDVTMELRLASLVYHTVHTS